VTGYLYQGSPVLAELNARVMADRSGSPIRRRTEPIEHGTRAGWQRHKRAGRQPCETCQEAYNAERLRARRRNQRKPRS